MPPDHSTDAGQASQLEALEREYATLGARNLDLDLTRGKPGAEQLALSDDLDGVLEGITARRTAPTRATTAGLAGLPEARALFGQILGVPPQETLVGGNASLSLMYAVVDCALHRRTARAGVRLESTGGAGKICLPEPRLRPPFSPSANTWGSR